MSHIVHFAKYYSPDAGGIESVTSSLAQGAVKAGHDVSVICFQNTPAEKVDIINGVRVKRARVAKLIASQPLGFGYFLNCILTARKADIVHLHAPNMLASLAALLLPTKIRLLVHWHSDVINKGFLGKLLRPLEHFLLLRADVIVATSDAYADSSILISSFRDKVTVVPIGISDVAAKSINYENIKKFETWVNCRKIILSVGRLVKYKGFDLLIAAAQKIPTDSVIVIVGSGPLEKELQDAIENINVQDKVLLAGRLSDSDLLALFDRADVYCLPSISRAEAFGVVLLEAMAFGLPIVASDISGSGVPWVNQHGVSGFNVPVGDSIVLAEALIKVLSCSDLRYTLSEGARQRFLTEFTEEISVNRILAVYTHLSEL
jgi:glycosyltransferase involved in cell wall biosynthesis